MRDKPYFAHPNALVESKKIGRNTRVWAFAHILPDAVIGEDCNICDQTFIENDVIVGDRVTIKCGVQLWDGITLEDDVFVGPNATFTNDPFPRSKQYPEAFARTVIRRGARSARRHEPGRGHHDHPRAGGGIVPDDLRTTRAAGRAFHDGVRGPVRQPASRPESRRLVRLVPEDPVDLLIERSRRIGLLRANSRDGGNDNRDSQSDATGVEWD